MFLIPSRTQWRAWSLPSKLTAIGALLAFVSFGWYAVEKLYHLSPWSPRMATESGQRELSRRFEMIERALLARQTIIGTADSTLAQWMDISALNAWYDIGWAIVLTDGRIVRISNLTSSLSGQPQRVNWDTVKVIESNPTYVRIGLPEVKYLGIETPFYTTIRVEKNMSSPISLPPWKKDLSEKPGTPVKMELGAFGSDERGVLLLIGLRSSSSR